MATKKYQLTKNNYKYESSLEGFNFQTSYQICSNRQEGSIKGFAVVCFIQKIMFAFQDFIKNTY